MDSLNSTTEAVKLRHILEGHNLFSETFRIMTYGVAGLVLLVNGAIASAFLIQKCRRPSAVQLSPAGLLVLNLLLADTLVGTFTILNIATFATNKVVNRLWCSARMGGNYLTLTGSHVALINVAIDRLVAISYTLQYRDWMTVPRSILMVCFGWLIPIAGAAGAAGAVVAAEDWRPEIVRCSDIHNFKIFLYYVFIPSHAIAIVCVIVIQSRVYLYLRRHEKASSTSIHNFRRFSNKSARILFRVTSTFVLCWGPFDVVLVIILLRVNVVIKIMYDLMRVFVYVPFLVNPLVYSYQTGNIRKPVTDLCTDIKKRWFPARVSTATRSQSLSAAGQLQGISIIENGIFFRKSPSASSGFTQSTSTT